jgi:hypothetical protein
MMKDLFLSECRRFRLAAIVFACVHLVVQMFINRMSDVLQWRWDMHVLALAVYMLIGLAFALYQLGTYRQPGRWVWLLHRPLPRVAIVASIGAASMALILFAVGLPALLTVLGADWLAGRTVDARHYMLVVHLVLGTAIAWLAGACIILSHSRSAVVVVVLPAVMLPHMAASVPSPARRCSPAWRTLPSSLTAPRRRGSRRCSRSRPRRGCSASTSPCRGADRSCSSPRRCWLAGIR